MTTEAYVRALPRITVDIKRRLKLFELNDSHVRRFLVVVVIHSGHVVHHVEPQMTSKNILLKQIDYFQLRIDVFPLLTDLLTDKRDLPSTY